MKLETKPLLTMEVTLTLNQSEVAMLNKLCSYGAAVLEPILGKNPLPDRTEPWLKFFKDVREATDILQNRFVQANEVFAGRKEPASRRRQEPVPLFEGEQQAAATEE